MALGFGAEVSGFDIHNGRDPDDVALLHAALDAYDLLVFRNCGSISPDRHMEIGGWFGPLEAQRGPHGEGWSRIGNDSDSGDNVPLFHSDMTMLEHPVEALSLHVLELPHGRTTTTFASSVVGWARLRRDLKQRAGDLRVRHCFHGGEFPDLGWPDLFQYHPIRKTHPRTGKDLLFVSQFHADKIEGMDDAEARELLERLFDCLYAPDCLYEHVWRDGDLIIWDNLAVQHARTTAPVSGERRVLQRVAVGAHSMHDQIEQVRARQAQVEA